LYNVYSQATFTQRAAVAALRTPADVLDERRRLASAAWQRAHEALRVPHTSVEGGLYTLLDLTAYVDGADAFLGRCIDAGVTLAPGTAFGGHLDRHARLCFTAVEPSLLAPALDIVNSVYEEGVR
jgi:N-succinyldiaminopimelate aminotransferase